MTEKSTQGQINYDNHEESLNTKKKDLKNAMTLMHVLTQHMCCTSTCLWYTMVHRYMAYGFSSSLTVTKRREWMTSSSTDTATADESTMSFVVPQNLI